MADTLCFYQNDPNGMLLRLWSSTGEVVWSAHYSVTGQAQVSASSRVWQPLRLQGQYFDAESGLHYNRFRYYDPRAGMFISQDPIGLSGSKPLDLSNRLTRINPLRLTTGYKSEYGSHGRKPTYRSVHHDPFNLISASLTVKQRIDLLMQKISVKF